MARTGAARVVHGRGDERECRRRDRGRKAGPGTGSYLVVVGSCNDCHTPHSPETAGQVPKSEWLAAQ